MVLNLFSGFFYICIIFFIFFSYIPIKIYIHTLRRARDLSAPHENRFYAFYRGLCVRKGLIIMEEGCLYVCVRIYIYTPTYIYIFSFMLECDYIHHSRCCCARHHRFFGLFLLFYSTAHLQRQRQ